MEIFSRRARVGSVYRLIPKASSAPARPQTSASGRLPELAGERKTRIKGADRQLEHPSADTLSTASTRLGRGVCIAARKKVEMRFAHLKTHHRFERDMKSARVVISRSRAWARLTGRSKAPTPTDI